MNKTKMQILANIGRFSTPAAMVVFLTYEISRSQSVSGWWIIPVLVGSLATSIGIEAVGILAGYAINHYWKSRESSDLKVVGFILVVYLILAVFMLRHNTMLVPVPIIAALVYVLAAMTESLEDTKIEQTQGIKEDRKFDRQMAILKAKQEQQQALAKIEANKQKAIAKVSQKSSQPVSQKKKTQSAKMYECACGRVFEGSRSYNGHKKHCKTSSEIPVKISANGHAK